MIRRTFACVAVAAALAWAGPARASCIAPPFTRKLVPVDGATGFPTDGALRVFLHGGWPEALRAGLAEEYRLRGPDGALVPLRPRVEGFVLALEPARPLAPDTTWTVEQLFAYADGKLLSDDERWRLAGGRGYLRPEVDTVPKDLVRAWFPVATFRTGKGPDVLRPPTPRLSEVRYSTAHRGESGGPGEWVGVSIAAVDGFAPGDVLGLEVKGHGMVWRGAWEAWPAVLGPAPEDGPVVTARASDLSCWEDKVHIDVERPPRMRAVAWSPSGRRSKPGPWVVAEPLVEHGRGPEPQKPHAARLAEGEARARPAVDAFLAPPVVEAAPLAGLAACPGGLAALDTSRLVSHRWVQNQKGRALTPGWMLVEGPDDDRHDVSLARLDAEGHPGAVLLLGDRRSARIVVPVDGEPPVVVASRQEPASIRAWRPSADGEPAWERVLGEGEARSGLFALSSGERVLVGWTRYREVEDRREDWPAWAILDAATGEIVGTGDLGAFGPATGVEAVAWTVEHFAVAWEWTVANARVPGQPLPEGGPPEGAWMALLHPDGSVERAFPLPVKRAIDSLVPTPGGWVAAWYDHGDTVVAWLDGEGAVEAGPWIVGGALGGIQDLAVNGDLVALAGGGYWSHPAVVVTVDHGGAVSPLHVLGRGDPSLDPAIEPWGDGFLAAFGQSLYPGHGWTVALERLACGTDPPLGPPLKIDR